MLFLRRFFHIRRRNRAQGTLHLHRPAAQRFLLPASALVLLSLLSCCVWAQTSRPLLIQGLVKSGRVPIPGATVTATNLQNGSKVVGWTEIDGTYSLQVATSGTYTIQVEMTGFAALKKDVTFSGPTARADLDLILQSRAHQAAPTEAGRNSFNRGFQSLAVTQGSEFPSNASDDVVPQGMPVPGIAPNLASESVSVNGNSSGSLMSSMSSDEMQQRMRESREQDGRGSGLGGPLGGLGPPGGTPIGGGRPGAGGPPPGGFFGGGRRGGFDINRAHASIYYSVGESALNASPYSLTGEPTIKPSYLQQRFGVSLGGPLNIPKIYHGGSKTFFFVNYNGSRSDNPFDAFSTVPTAGERGGDFATICQSGFSSGICNDRDASGNVIHQLYSPFTNGAVPNNDLNAAGLALNPAALGLLPFIPLPNLPGTAQNFHFVTSATDNSDDLNVRVIQSLGGGSINSRRRGPQNNLTIGFHYHSVNETLTNDYPSVGGTTSTRSFDVPLGYIRSFGKLTNVARVDFNRSRVSTQNLYAFSQDITGQLGISGVSQNPFDWGLPNLSFTNFGSLQDTNPELLRNQTWTFSDSMIWSHAKHTFRWGGDFRRIQLNTETDSNARGSFVFTGLNTAATTNGMTIPNTGYDFADFLLGLPQQTSVQFGENNYHFRGNSWDLYAQDEWKVRGNLSLNLGLRYEYVSPLSELNDRIVNLDVSPGFTAAVPVFPNQAGPYNGIFPGTLLRPDRNNFAPRLGLAWKPLRNTVVRAGYGVNYNTTAYNTIVQNLAFQPPFSVTQTNVQAAVGQLTLQNGFPSQPNATTNNYGIDPNYRLGYVQIWNLDIQQELRPTLLLNLDYTGTKGTRLDILEAPNRDASGIRIPGVQPFTWENSVGDSTAHAATVRLRKRLQRGISIGGSYTYSKSLDDASTIGSGIALTGPSLGQNLVAQNAFDLAAERGLSSFDQRHRFTADYLWELPFGHDRLWLTQPGALRALFGDWQWSGDWTIASGLPFTPRVLGNFSDVNRGTNGTLRPDVTGTPVALPDPSVSEWFNTAAFTLPPAGQFGDARRNSIEGPGTHLFDMAFTKVFPLKESRLLEVRAQFSNIFNTPQFTSIDAVVNSPTYGRVIAAGSMRTVQFTVRFRY